MMDWSDRHWRVFARTLTKKALLYTEMITASALVHGDLEKLTEHSPSEYPLALQIGGSNPDELYQATARVKDLGFCEINLNLGCPSDRVQAGCFGAALMANPTKVSECFNAMRNASGSAGPKITAKIRLGIDDQNPEDTLPDFIEMLNNSNITHVIIHARKAILGGLSPKQNREIPPLNYKLVHQIKNEFPEMEIVLNGGLKTIDQCISELGSLDGVMVGRAAYQNPTILLRVDRDIFKEDPPNQTAFEALLSYRSYIEQVLAKGFPLKHLTRHLVGLYHEVPGARQFRRILSERAHLAGADWSVIEDALAAIPNVENL
jgi:tRNA-dihydrouridine synthase A